MHNFARPQTVEDSFRAYANFSGIHEFKFDKLYEQSADGWTTDTAAIITADADTLTIDASGEAAGWYAVLQDAELPSEILLRYHKTAIRQGAIVGAQSDGTHYIVGTDSSGFPSFQKWNGATYTTILSIQKDTPVEADVMVAFREFKFGENIDEFWHSMSLWMNDALIATYTTVSASGQITDGTQFGFAAYGGDDPVEYTQIAIPEMTEYAEWSSLDPAEYPIGGLNRAIEGRYLKFFLRFNGAMRAWKPKATDSVRIWDTDDAIEGRRTSFDKRQLKTHVRQVGAYSEAEYIRTDLWRKYGHTFIEVNNPYLMTEAECFREAQRVIQRSEQEALQESFQVSVTPLVEPEDRITTPSGEWIVGSKSLELNPAQIEQGVNARLYNFS